MMKHLKEDKAVFNSIQEELNRQRNKLEMIASRKILPAMRLWKRRAVY